MDKQTLEILEYYRVRNIIACYASSVEGKLFVESKEPSVSKSKIDEEKALAEDWMKSLISANPIKILSFNECSPIFQLLQVDSYVLELEQIAALGSFCKSTIQFKKQMESETIRLQFSVLADKAALIPDLSMPNSKIFRIIDETGVLKDLPELREIRKSISRIRRDVTLLFKSYTTDQSLKDVLQSDMPVLRSDRQVLAVKANFRGRIKGIVHEFSQTGQTVYIEPDDIVQKNNALVQEEHRLTLEIRRIFRELTASLAEFYEDFVTAHNLMINIDGSYAAAKWGIEMRCSFANISENNETLSLKDARHPLLAEKAVPISLSFLPNRRILIITGPNTGGKTVSLKTVALFAALNQSGFPLPCAEGSVLPLFDNIYADIGDEQSMDQSLSTFSGHMKNIAKMIDAATDKTLVLLDELGCGTDPEEGGAIAMAVLDFLIEKKAWVLVTTHNGSLKNYGYTRVQCSNASVEFDETTLSPAYRIIMGVPGESHALEIARRNGLSEEIILNAENYLNGAQADVSSLIKGLTSKYAELEEIEKNKRKETNNLLRKQQEINLKELDLRKKEYELREKGYRKLSEFADNSRKQLENLVRTLREGEITREKTLAVKDFIAKLQDSLDEEKTNLEIERESLTAAQNERLKQTKNKDSKNFTDDEQTEVPSEFAEGLDVFYKERRGVLLRQQKKNTWVVAFDTFKMTINQKELVLAPIIKKNTTVSLELALQPVDDGNIKGASFGISCQKAVFELRLLGMRYEEAIKALEKQIDLAMLQHLKNFSVVHGKGHGVLQQGVQNYLKSSPVVESFCFAPAEDGGTGKTYVTLL
ncbi:MAG: endonuclease MutS2 [Treponema sp.]|jgi:DNA mismatch repair protein MutS2|nr:endonuclease MutS2 [Treponema sp.]